MDVFDDEERLARLRLIRSERIGPMNFAHLISRFNTATEALKALPTLGGGRGKAFIPYSRDRAEQEITSGIRLGARPIFLGEKAYPYLLAAIDAPPPVLWVKGPFMPSRKSVAVIGARNASVGGMKMAGALATDLSQAGFCIVSGLARGIDGQAHEKSLSGGTVAVLGGGIDDIYPPEHQKLYEAICQNGLVVSESPVGHTAQAKDFPRRNRLIAGLALATIVVEAELRSGSLITARLASEMGREVFAVPGSPLDPRASGANSLLKNGAQLCTTAQDVVDSLSPQLGFFEEDPQPFRHVPKNLTPENLTPQTNEIKTESVLDQVLNALSSVPTHRDELIRHLNCERSVVLSAIIELEICGLISVNSSGGLVRSMDV